MRHPITSFITAFLTIALSLSAFADPGDLDLSFGKQHKGWVSNAGALGFGAIAYDGIQQQDGKFVVTGASYTNDPFIVGTHQLCLMRYNIDGTLDTSFNGTGMVVTTLGQYSQGQTLIQQQDGKLVMAGAADNGSDSQGNLHYDAVLVRYNLDGTLDTSFGSAGIVTTQGYEIQNMYYGLVQQADGKLVAAGYFLHGSSGGWLSDIVLVRYNTDGSLDSSFGVNGIVISFGGAAINMVLQPNGKIIISASFGDWTPWHLLRYNSNGSLDTSFGVNGVVTTTFASSSMSQYGTPYPIINTILLQGNGMIVAGGSISVQGGNFDDFALARYNTDGSLDNTFGINGLVITDLGSNYDQADSLVQQNDGKLILAGQGGGVNTSMSLARYNADGTLDKGFGKSGIITTKSLEPVAADEFLHKIMQQSDGKLVAIISDDATNDHFIVARLLGDDSNDGDDDHDEHGTTVTTADIDGDGTDDIITGAPQSDIINETTTIQGVGSIKIISGKDHTLLHKFNGNTAGQHFGSAIAAVADQNSDGVPDLLVGEPSLNRVSLYSGADGTLIKTIVSGAGKDSRFGAAIAMGDVNNDAIADLVVGALHSGTVYVYDGSTVFSAVNPAPLYTRMAPHTGEAFGAAVAVDNQQHLLVGSPAHKIPGVKFGIKIKLSNVGAVDIFDGSAGNSATLFTLEGTQANEKFGSSISALASNGNWIIGSPGANISNIINGKTVVAKGVGKVQIFSSADASLITTSNGNARGDHFGSAINAAADIDKDGTSDLVVGASTSDVSRPINGQYVLKKRSGRVNVIKSATP